MKTDKRATYSTGYKKWNAEHRENLVSSLSYVEFSEIRDSFWFPKLSSNTEPIILDKILSFKSSVPEFIGKSNKRVYYRTTGGLYWKVFTDFSPDFFVNGKAGNSSRETSIAVTGENNHTQIVGMLSSSTFWWWYTLTSSLRDLNPSDINGFRFDSTIFSSNSILELSKEYLNDLQENSQLLQRIQKNVGTTETQSFKISKSKHIIDQIDTVLAQYYGFSEEELDFIINYDIKYRMGKALFGEGDSEEEEESEE
jgi:hypothetical protein